MYWQEARSIELQEIQERCSVYEYKVQISIQSAYTQLRKGMQEGRILREHAAKLVAKLQ